MSSTLVFPVVLPVKSVSRRCDHGCGHVLELECQVLQRCCFGVKVRQLRECSRPDERSALSGCRGFRFHPQFCLCCVQVPVVRQVCQLSCGCLLCFQNRLTLMLRLLLSRQLLLEIRHDLFHGRVNPSSSPVLEFENPQYQKVTTSAHVYQSAATKVRTTTG